MVSERWRSVWEAVRWTEYRDMSCFRLCEVRGHFNAFTRSSTSFTIPLTTWTFSFMSPFVSAICFSTASTASRHLATSCFISLCRFNDSSNSLRASAAPACIILSDRSRSSTTGSSGSSEVMVGRIWYNAVIWRTAQIGRALSVSLPPYFLRFARDWVDAMSQFSNASWRDEWHCIVSGHH